jgi:selenocysteine-specific elongation factor
MSGFGTIVTGTLSDGHLSVGDEVEILPSSQKGRIRGLQTHKKKEDTAIPGSRTAVNISGVEQSPSNAAKLWSMWVNINPREGSMHDLRLLKDVSYRSSTVTSEILCGRKRNIATLRLLGKEELIPGDQGWIQLELREPVVAVRGDRYHPCAAPRPAKHWVEARSSIINPKDAINGSTRMS